MKTDSLFYRMFQTWPRLLFDMLGEPVTPAEHYSFQSLELKQTALRVDGIFAPPPDQPDWPVFFIEVQFQPDERLYARLFTELFLYLYQYNPPHPWQAIAIYPNRATERAEQSHYQILLDSHQVQRIYLDEWAAASGTLSQRLIHLLLSKPKQAIPESQSLLATSQIQTLDKPLQSSILELIETILVYKLPTLSRQEIQTMLGFTENELKQSRYYQEVFAEGRQEGRHDEASALVLRQLKRRCGLVDANLSAQVENLSLTQLETLSEALLDFKEPADLVQWLQQNAPVKS